MKIDQINNAFVARFNLNSEKIKKLLLNIQVEDFCHSIQNKKLGYEHEILYVFCPKVELVDIWANESTVDVYTKFNIVQYNSTSRTVVISLHERNKPIDYCFSR
jgi:hypothetical protein